MIRILFFLAVVFALGLGFAWLADRPGDMVVTFGGYQYRFSLMLAAVAVVLVVALVMIGWWLVKSIWNGPYTIARYFRVRQRDRGYQALSAGMIAAGAGDAALARRMNRQAVKLLRSETEPLVGLLDAQASLLEGNHEAARQKFERMLDDPEMRLLGLRGLYLEAERLGDRTAARHYAGRAADIAPQLDWAAESTIEEKTARGDWDGALRLLDARKGAAYLDRETANRHRAVLLTAKAQDLIDTDLPAAKAAALEAHRLRQGFAPAAVIAAKTLFKANDIRKGAKILEAAWRLDAHPEIAALYVHARAGDAVLDRLHRARKLLSQKQNHAESYLAVARAAFDAQEYSAAREAVETALRIEPREGAFLLLADIEEAQTGDEGRVRQHLARAVRAPRDPAWVADGVVSERWAPASPVTGRLDAFEWRAPMERLGQLIEQDAGEDPPDVSRPTLSAPAAPAPAGPQEPVVHAPAASPDGLSDGPPEAAAAAPPTNDADGLGPDSSEEAEPRAPGQERDSVDGLAHMPDDPGVDPREPDNGSRRFRLF